MTKMHYVIVVVIVVVVVVVLIEDLSQKLNPPPIVDPLLPNNLDPRNP